HRDPAGRGHLLGVVDGQQHGRPVPMRPPGLFAIGGKPNNWLAAHWGVTYAPEMPPSTRNVVAVPNEASSLARKATAAAIASGPPKRPMGTWTSRRCAASGSAA